MLADLADRLVTLLSRAVLAALQHRVLTRRNHLLDVTPYFNKYVQFVPNIPRIVSSIAELYLIEYSRPISFSVSLSIVFTTCES